MTIHYISDDSMFNYQVDCYVNPVNCMGVSGKGLALEFKKRFPEAQKQYEHYCKEGVFTPGRILWTYPSKNLYLVYFATKNHWKNPSQIEWINEGMYWLKYDLTYTYELNTNVKSIAIPALGCGLGGLDWNDVKPIIEKFMENLDVEVYIFEPQ